ncbi:hypothetical protein pipiens_001024, partial [Culex pipiens pipiens]
MLSSKLDKMHNLVNKMRDGMNQVKQGVAIFQQSRKHNPTCNARAASQ